MSFPNLTGFYKNKKEYDDGQTEFRKLKDYAQHHNMDAHLIMNPDDEYHILIVLNGDAITIKIRLDYFRLGDYEMNRVAEASNHGLRFIKKYVSGS